MDLNVEKNIRTVGRKHRLEEENYPAGESKRAMRSKRRKKEKKRRKSEKRKKESRKKKKEGVDKKPRKNTNEEEVTAEL